jgi:integrase
VLALEQWVDRLLPSWPLVAAPGAAGEELRQGNEAAGEKLVPYSARHGYGLRAHLICERPPKVAAAAMGHSVETHLAAYSKWCGDEVVDDAFERAATRLGR